MGSATTSSEPESERWKQDVNDALLRTPNGVIVPYATGTMALDFSNVISQSPSLVGDQINVANAFWHLFDEKKLDSFCQFA